MTRALYDRIEAIESFAADVAHELKNPLTSLRSAVETLPLARSDESRDRLIERHPARRAPPRPADQRHLRRLAPRRRAGARPRREPVDVVRLLETVDLRRQRGPARRRRDASASTSPPHPLRPRRLSRHGPRQPPRPGHQQPRRERALLLAATAARCASRCAASGPEVEIVVEDDGPGIPAARAGAHLRALLHRPAGPGLRPEFRPRPVDLPPDRRGASRPHLGREPLRGTDADAGRRALRAARRFTCVPRCRAAAAAMSAAPRRVAHASCVVVGEAGVLHPRPVRQRQVDAGAPRSWTLAARGGGFARLVGDDRVSLAAQGGRLVARPHPAIAGRVEVRGIGIRDAAHAGGAVVAARGGLWSAPTRQDARYRTKCVTDVMGVEVRRVVARARTGRSRPPRSRGCRFFCNRRWNQTGVKLRYEGLHFSPHCTK